VDNKSTRWAYTLLSVGTLTWSLCHPFSDGNLAIWREDTPLCLDEYHVPFRLGALLRHLTPQNLQATRTQKTLLLDSFVEWTGYHRKYAIALLNHGEHDRETIQRRPLPGLFPGNSAERAVF
jgi:hypothetical protein